MICGKQLSADDWNCILAPGHAEPWHLTLIGRTWLGDDPATLREGFPPLPHLEYAEVTTYPPAQPVAEDSPEQGLDAG